MDGILSVLSENLNSHAETDFRGKYNKSGLFVDILLIIWKGSINTGNQSVCHSLISFVSGQISYQDSLFILYFYDQIDQ